MTAAGTQPIEFKTVGLNGKSVQGRDFFLKSFNVTVFEFHNLPTACADQMVVMTFVGDVIVLGLGSEVPRLSKAGFTEQVERTVNGRQSEMGIFTGELVVQLFRGDMFLSQKCIKDEFALTRILQLVLPEMLLQDSHFFGMFRHVNWTKPPRRGIKDEIGLSVKSLDDASSFTRPPLTAAS